MPMGPGVYDALCTMVRKRTKAKAVLVIVLDGIHGSGFSVQSVGEDIVDKLPELLRHCAATVEDSLE